VYLVVDAAIVDAKNLCEHFEILHQFLTGKFTCSVVRVQVFYNFSIGP